MIFLFFVVKFVCDEMLASCLWKSLLFLLVLHAFYRHLNTILIHFYWLLLLESVLRFPALLSRVMRKPVIWILSQFNGMVATSCGTWVWEISEQITNSFISFLSLFTCTLLLYSSFAGIFWLFHEFRLFHEF